MKRITCLSYWFPLIQAAGLPVPRTEIVRTDCELLRLAGSETPEGCTAFLAELYAAAERIGYPCFLRTGQTSNKHEWRDSCHLLKADNLEQHVYNLVVFSEICDCFGIPSNVWVVRELISTTPAFHAFRDMPIVREFRVFTKDNKAICIHPYWPEYSIRQPNDEDWKGRLAVMSDITPTSAGRLGAMAENAAKATEHGDWSVDFLQDSTGNWWLTDMAEADKSWHWPGCQFSNTEPPRTKAGEGWP